jgi:flagellar basal-body rod protein FlgG
MYLSVIGNNLANINTVGFKAQRAAFEDLLYTTIGTEQGAAQGQQMGLGVRISGVQAQVYEQGPLQTTGQPFDVAIEGQGFIPVQLANGQTGYTRAGNLGVDASGQLVTPDGNVVQPRIVCPPGATDFTIGHDGTVTCKAAGSVQVLGHIKVATFTNPGGLEQLGGNLFGATAASGAAQLSTPGQNGTGQLVQGMLEMSNVHAVDEMVNMITTQRAYESVAKVVTASDEMLSTANGLRR